MIQTPAAVSGHAKASPPAFEILIRALDDRRCVVAVIGEIDLATAPELKTTLLEWLERGYREFVLDLSGLRHMDSTGLAVLIGLRKHLADDGTVTLAGTPPSVAAVLEMTGLTTQFEQLPSVDEVRDHLSGADAGGRPGLTAEAAMAIGLISTALPFAGSRGAEAERWLRVLRSHGDAARILGDTGVGEAAAAEPRSTAARKAAGQAPAAQGEPVTRVIEQAARVAAERGVGAIGTSELLTGVMAVYGEDFERVLRAHGARPGTVTQAPPLDAPGSG